MKLTRILALALCAVMCLGMFVGCNKDEEYIVIGMSGPLTGGASIYGEAVRNSALLAIEEINAKGGLNGIKFKLEALDDKHDASQISTNFASLMDKGMQVSLGTVTTAPGLEFKNYAKEENVFFLTPSASNDDVPEFANGYQMCFADSNQGKAAATFVNTNLAGKTIGAFYKADEDYSKGIFEQFKANVSGVTIVETSFTDANATDFASQISTLKASGCDFIFMPTYYGPASLFMTQAKAELPANATYFGCDGFDGIDGIEGFDITTIPQKIVMLSHFDSSATSGVAKEFIDKYVAKYGKDTLNQFGASAYDCVYALYGAMQKAVAEGKTIDSKTSASDLCEILKAQFQGGYALKNGVTGNGVDITWDANGYVNKGATQFTIKEANS